MFLIYFWRDILTYWKEAADLILTKQINTKRPNREAYTRVGFKVMIMNVIFVKKKIITNFISKFKAKWFNL